MSYRTAIVDDEPLARRNLRSLLKPHKEFEIIAECKSGEEALALVNSTPIDVLFLDVQMPEMDGFQVIERLNTTHMPVIVFVTAFDQFAIKAFEVSALDYLLKPVDQVRFEQALRRAQRQLDGSDVDKVAKRLSVLLAAHSEGQTSYARRLLVKNGPKISFLPVDDIDYIEASDYYAALHVGAKVHLLRESMKDLEARLDPNVFLRIHRSAIVNVARIKELRHVGSGAYTVHLEGGTSLKTSRSRCEQIQTLLAR